VPWCDLESRGGGFPRRPGVLRKAALSPQGSSVWAAGARGRGLWGPLPPICGFNAAPLFGSSGTVGYCVCGGWRTWMVMMMVVEVGVYVFSIYYLGVDNRYVCSSGFHDGAV
jgi:hypothetical protein